MKLRIKKTDGRHVGNAIFRYMVLFAYKSNEAARYKEISDIRQWCWEQFGPSCEYHEYVKIVEGGLEVNNKWCWLDSSRILLISEKERNWFLLRWS